MRFLPVILAKDKKGLTLVELLVTLAILSLVLSVGYGFYYSISRHYLVGSKQSHVHQNVRLAQDMIEKKIRHANKIIIIPSGDPPPSSEDGDDYDRIYLDDDTNRIMLTVKDGAPQDLLQGLSGNVKMELSFEKTEEYMVEMTIKGDPDGKNEYVVSSEIIFLKTFSDNEVGNTGNQICLYSTK